MVAHGGRARCTRVRGRRAWSVCALKAASKERARSAQPHTQSSRNLSCTRNAGEFAAVARAEDIVHSHMFIHVYVCKMKMCVYVGPGALPCCVLRVQRPARSGCWRASRLEVKSVVFRSGPRMQIGRRPDQSPQSESSPVHHEGRTTRAGVRVCVPSLRLCASAAEASWRRTTPRPRS